MEESFVKRAENVQMFCKKFEEQIYSHICRFLCLFAEIVKIGGEKEFFCRFWFASSGKCLPQASAAILNIRAFSGLYFHDLKYCLYILKKSFFEATLGLFQDTTRIWRG